MKKKLLLLILLTIFCCLSLNSCNTFYLQDNNFEDTIIESKLIKTDLGDGKTIN